MLSSPSISKLSLVVKHPGPTQFCLGISGFLTAHHVIQGCVLFSYAYRPLRDPQHKPIVCGKRIVVLWNGFISSQPGLPVFVVVNLHTTASRLS